MATKRAGRRKAIPLMSIVYFKIPACVILHKVVTGFFWEKFLKFNFQKKLKIQKIH